MCVEAEVFFNLLGLTLLLNEATGAEPSPLASPLLCGHAPLAAQSERPSVLGLCLFSAMRGSSSRRQSDSSGAGGNVRRQILTL